MADRAGFQRADWCQGVEGQFDLIVSNPPYIAAGDPHLAALRHEPASALVAEGAGLADIERIVAGAPARLKPAAWLLIEHGFDQAKAVRERLLLAGFNAVVTRCDLAGRPRASGGKIAAGPR